jgi:rRNA-processing protein FCF1
MNRHVLTIINKFKDRGIIVDTNLMLLLIIGIYSPYRIETFKRTNRYTRDDFDILGRLLTPFKHRITTPFILTEVDNLSRQLPEREHDAIANIMVQVCTKLFEIRVPSLEVMKLKHYPKIGLTDSLLLLSAEEYVVLTDDFTLSNRIQSLNLPVINMNHLRRLI